MTTNPLQKYFRQPKLFISLPSKGVYYPQGSFLGDSNNVPIFAMTGMDEVMMKTPDALFNGEATIKVIESCCPYIKNGKQVPSLDIDTILVSIRMATFGENMTIGHVCKNCGAENDFDIDLRTVIDHYSGITFDGVVPLNLLTVTLRPLTYQEMSDFNVENFKLQRMLAKLADAELEEAERRKYVDEIYEKLADIQLSLILASIEDIQTPDGPVDDKTYIKEWLKNITRDEYDIIKSKLEDNKTKWSIPKQKIKCSECSTEDEIEVAMDQSNFFVKR